jgi:leader peptidase (prepilin peptidase)/N-methyltransferase
LVEGFTALMFVGVAAKFPLALAIPYLIFGCLIMIGFCTDMDFLIIPDRVTLGGMGVGLVASALVPALHGVSSAWDGFNAALLGAFVGGGVLWVIATLGTNLLKREAMGMGDVKLLLAVGAFLGWQGAIFTIMMGSVIGAVMGLAVLLLRRQHLGSFVAVPFGPPLMIAAGVWIMGGNAWWVAYFNLFRSPFR